MYHYKQLPFGVSSAPATFQRIMDQLLQRVKFTVCCLDDIVISGGSPEEHLAILEGVFGRLQEHGIRLNPASAFFSSRDLSFLDTGLTKTALVPSLRIWIQSCKPRVLPVSQSWSRIWNLTIMASSCPILRLCSFLFMTCCKSIDLGSGQRSAREHLLKVRSSYKILLFWPIMIWRSHFGWPVIHDHASPYGVGAVIFHSMENGEEEAILLLHLELSQLVNVTIPK